MSYVLFTRSVLQACLEAVLHSPHCCSVLVLQAAASTALAQQSMKLIRSCIRLQLLGSCRSPTQAGLRVSSHSALLVPAYSSLQHAFSPSMLLLPADILSQPPPYFLLQHESDPTCSLFQQSSSPGGFPLPTSSSSTLPQASIRCSMSLTSLPCICVWNQQLV